MRSSGTSTDPRDNGTRHPFRRHPAVPGRLSLAEDVLYSGARGIDKAIDLVLDRPAAALAFAAALLALFALLGRG